MTAYNRDGIESPGLALRRVMLDLGPDWKAEAEALALRLKKENIDCLAGLPGQDSPDAAQNAGTVLLTDNPAGLQRCARTGAVCFACSRPASRKSWFPGTVLVLESLGDIDGRYLEEWMQRARGLPAGIARSERLVLREIAELDVRRLIQIAGQCGPKTVSEEAFFTEENLPAYAKTAYRLQGFGLWTVLLQGSVIGCCGFAPFEQKSGPAGPDEPALYRLQFPASQMKEPQDRIVLELQYMLDPAFQRQGYGTEMCRAAISYAKDRLSADEIQIRIRQGNRASQALAEKLAFCRVS